MIAVDTNILVYSHREDCEWFAAASSCVTRLAEGSAPWAIPWPCVHEFLAIATNPRIFQPPTPLELALDQVESWLESPTLQLIAENPGYWPALRKCVAEAKTRGGAIHDARIAALCMYHRVTELWTADRDFSRFPGIRLVNPLVG